MSKRADGRDVFETALDDEYALTGDDASKLLLAGVVGGMLGGRAIGKRLASKARRKAEDAAIARASRDGSLGWGRGKDSKLIESRQRRQLIGGTIGSTGGMAGAVYAGTSKKDKKRK